MSKPLVIGAAAVIILGVAAFFILGGDSLTEAEMYTLAQQNYDKGSFEESVALYERLLADYPESEHRGDALFLTAYIYGNELKQIEKARGIYSQFLDEFPGHKMAEAAQFDLNYLGKSEEEMDAILQQLIDGAGDEGKIKK